MSLFDNKVLILVFCYVFTLFKTFEYVFVSCKQSKNKYAFSFSFLFMCTTVSSLYNVYNINYNNNCLFHIFHTQLFAIMVTTEIFKPRLFSSHSTSHKADWILTYSLFCSQRRSLNHNCFVHTQLHTRLTEFLLIRYFAYNGDLQTTIVLFTRNFTQGWLNSYCSLPDLSCRFYMHK